MLKEVKQMTKTLIPSEESSGIKKRGNKKIRNDTGSCSTSYNYFVLSILIVFFIEGGQGSTEDKLIHYSIPNPSSKVTQSVL